MPRVQRAMVAIMGVLLALAAAAFVGNLVRVVSVGPLFVDCQGRRWRASWQPLTFGLGGRAILSIRGGGHLGRRRAIFAAGGPAANLLLALAAGLAAAALPWPVTAAGAVGLGLLEGCAIEGCLLALLNLLPVPGTGTDGARIREALRGPV